VTSDNSTIAQLCNLIISDGIDSAINFLDSHQEVFSEKESEINILSKMFRDADTDEAIQLLLFNKKMHTDSWQTQFELGFTYKLKGDLSLAKEYILKAQELNPENSEIISLLNEINEAEE